jgi:hypothetical protein
MKEMSIITRHIRIFTTVRAMLEAICPLVCSHRLFISHEDDEEMYLM